MISRGDRQNRFPAGTEAGFRKASLARIVLGCILFCAVASGLPPAGAEPSPPHEYQVKAAFLYTFIKFVDWPNPVAGSASRPICMGILGQDPFGGDLESFKGKSAMGRPIVVRYFRKVEEVRDCDALFISSSEKGRLERILKHLQNNPILTVADHEGAAQAGVMINMVTTGNKVGFEINVAAARRARLFISSKLLKLAKTVIE